MEHTIKYPSGKVLRVFGRFSGFAPKIGPTLVVQESAFINKQIVPVGSVAVFDQRCVITDGDKRVVYDPSKYIEQMHPELMSWMKDHPEWPPKNAGRE